jgi:hypothetical protein
MLSLTNMDSESDFVKQFTGSATANLAFGVLFMLYLGLKKFCERDTKCKSKCHTCCLDISVRDSTLREKPEPTISEA